MKLIKPILSGLCIWLLLFHYAQAANKDEQINTILEETGFNKLLQHVPEFAQLVLKQSSGALEPEINSALSGAFSQAFATPLVQRDVIDIMNAHYDEKHATAYINALQTPLANKMAELERNTNDPANREEMTVFAASLEKEPAPRSRTALIERLDQANRATDFSVDMQTAFFRAIFVAIEPVMEADMRLGEGELEKMVDEVRTSLEESLRNNTRLSYTYAFRDVSDAELTKYIEMCETEDYRWAVQLLGNAMISAINQAADRAAATMADAASQQ